jgi:hypothetical protein
MLPYLLNSLSDVVAGDKILLLSSFGKLKIADWGSGERKSIVDAQAVGLVPV